MDGIIQLGWPLALKLVYLTAFYGFVFISTGRTGQSAQKFDIFGKYTEVQTSQGEWWRQARVW